MIIRAAHEADAPAMGQVMVEAYLAAHRDQMPADAWTKRAQEWTPEESARGWARTLHAIAAGERLHECIYVAVDDDGDLVGLAMGGPANEGDRQQIGAVYALYVSMRHQGQGLGRCLVQAVAAELAEHGMATLQIGCLAANAPARAFYEAIGGRLVSKRLFDEDGIMLPEVVYKWANIKALAARGQPEPEKRRPA
jgi:ribosomal protein S18 acetylase RimI-like enzyme